MNLIPKYSYEYNCILNESFDEMEQIKNFASLLSDKDRFLVLLQELEKNKDLIEKTLGFKLPKEVEFHVVRAEKFKSFSEPITIEYSLLPEEMILFLLKEIIKISAGDTRFPDDILREQYVNSLIEHILINGDFKEDLVKYGKNLHDESKFMFKNYEFKDVDFKDKTLKTHIEEMYNNN